MPLAFTSLPPYLIDDLGIVGQSAPIQALRQQIRNYGRNHYPVLIEGESGSGKERIAQALHQASGSFGPMVTVNCSAIPGPLLESTLFGHGRGAYTDAHESRAGLFEEAQGGVLLLDEIGELPLELQPKLLRVLEDGSFRRLGETRLRRCQARILASTNRNLRHDASQGLFRIDLYHRLATLTLRAPPLRELGDDKLLLMQYFRQIHAAQMQVAEFHLRGKTQLRWTDYGFPGNVRELRNLVIRLLCRFHGQTVDLAELEGELLEPGSLPQATFPLPEGFSLPSILYQQEQHYISIALKRARGNISQAARLLGLPRSTLCSRLQALDMQWAEHAKS